MTMLGIFFFSLALATSAYAIWACVAPNVDKILDALAGRPRYFAPLDVAPARRRLVRQWEVAPARTPVPVRAAA